MAKNEGAVLALVREELQRDPNATATELFDKAKKVDRSIGKLTIRQFHARYPLQIKRQLAAQRPRRPRRTRGKVVDRAAIGAELLAFASALLEAEGAGVVDVLGSVDANVDRILSAAGAA